MRSDRVSQLYDLLCPLEPDVFVVPHDSRMSDSVGQRRGEEN